MPILYCTYYYELRMFASRTMRQYVCSLNRVIAGLMRKFVHNLQVLPWWIDKNKKLNKNDDNSTLCVLWSNSLTRNAGWIDWMLWMLEISLNFRTIDYIHATDLGERINLCCIHVWTTERESAINQKIR